MFIISLRGNYLYGYGIGQTDEKRLLFAWANVAADVWKAFGLVAVSMLWRARQWRLALVALDGLVGLSPLRSEQRDRRLR